jgi:hypothetical protein
MAGCAEGVSMAKMRMKEDLKIEFVVTEIEVKGNDISYRLIPTSKYQYESNGKKYVAVINEENNRGILGLMDSDKFKISSTKTSPAFQQILMNSYFSGKPICILCHYNEKLEIELEYPCN